MKKYYSQYGEDVIIENFFNGKIGTLLDLGANDGLTFSNSRAFTEAGWSAVLVEASPITFNKLSKLYEGNDKVICIEKCLSDSKKTTKFFHNIYHNNPLAGNNKDLLSTIDENSYRRTVGWGSFETFDIECDTLDSVLKSCPFKKFELISIDVEGLDLQVLHQMDLNDLGVELLVIEHNSTIKNEILDYCLKFKMDKVLFENEVNIILHR